MPYYYVETMQGCGIRSATNIQQARKSALAESGTSNFKSIRKATKSDVEWVRAMGGYIPEISHLTPREPDKRDSAASQAVFKPKRLSTKKGLSPRPQAGNASPLGRTLERKRYENKNCS